MDQKTAFRETVVLAGKLHMPELPGNPLGFGHLIDMQTKILSEDFPEDKLGRWLGWAQCALVAAEVGATMEDMRQINLRATSPEPWKPGDPCGVCGSRNTGWDFESGGYCGDCGAMDSDE